MATVIVIPRKRLRQITFLDIVPSNFSHEWRYMYLYMVTVESVNLKGSCCYCYFHICFDNYRSQWSLVLEICLQNKWNNTSVLCAKYKVFNLELDIESVMVLLGNSTRNIKYLIFDINTSILNYRKSFWAASWAALLMTREWSMYSLKKTKQFNIPIKA